MAWLATSKRWPTEHGWYWVDIPGFKALLVLEWKYGEWFGRDSWYLDGNPIPVHSMLSPVRYWGKALTPPRLPRERKVRAKVPAEPQREVYP